jgi:hypothetical protein
MRCYWGVATLACALASPTIAHAQAPAADLTASSSEPAQFPDATNLGYGAMPGGLNALAAESLPKGTIAILGLSGLGRRTGLLGPTDRFNRAIGDLAFAYAPIENLTLGLSLDGYYDRHWGLPTSGDDGYVGNPHLLVRYARPVGALSVGAQLGLWIPGANAPSLRGSATTLDLRAVATATAGPARISVDAGYRVDNSANSVSGGVPGIAQLSLQDRVSLGVSEYNAVLAGLRVEVPVNRLWLAAELTLEDYVGSPPKGAATLERGSSLFRGALEAGMHLNDTWGVLAYVQVAKSPGIETAQVMAGSIPIVPYEPSGTVGLGLLARFGGPVRGSLYAEKACHRHDPPDCQAVKVPITADISGTVVDDSGKPMIGAHVTLTLENSQVPPTATDEKGAYVFKGVPIGTSIDDRPALDETGIAVNVTLDGKKPGTGTIATVAAGANTVPPITLEAALPPGQLRGLVRALPAGKAIPNATITVEPGGKKLESGADGSFSLDLQPGAYTMTVTAKGFAAQKLDVTIDPNGVAIKNIDLHR